MSKAKDLFLRSESLLKIVFFGTPFFAEKILEALLDEGIEPIALVTQPDRPRGRSLKRSASAVKAFLLNRGSHIPIYEPEKAREESFLEELRLLKPDLLIVVAYGQILPKKLLEIPKLGAINIHASLLPKYRGAAPMQRALMAGEKKTGISIQKMVYKMDAGDVLVEKEVKIDPDMTLQELEKKLIEEARPLLIELLRKKDFLSAGVAQKESLVSFAPKITPEETQIFWNLPAKQIHDLIRGLSPKPGAWSWFWENGVRKRVKILRSKKTDSQGPAGGFSPKREVFCKTGALRLIEVIPEGKRAMSGESWLRGNQKISFLET